MLKYKLVNPFIDGKMSNEFKGKSNLQVASKVWSSLSSQFAGAVPHFAFSLERMSDGQLSHYLVKENINNDEVNYTISEMEVQENNLYKDFKNKLNKMTVMKGGVRKLNLSGGKDDEDRKHKKKHDDDDDDDDDDDESSESDDELKERLKSYLRRIKKNNHSNIYYWWYYPYIYTNLTDYVFPVLTPNNVTLAVVPNFQNLTNVTVEL